MSFAMLMNAPAILNELLYALKNLYEKGEEHIIYINKIPLSEADRVALLDILGEGQVRIWLSSKTHPAEWRETGISGIWIGVFYDRDNKPILETIEVCHYPGLARTQREDIEEAITKLRDRMESMLPREF